MIEIYTDGACLGNPGPGGWAAILTSGSHRKEISGGFKLTTNNRMEIKAAIEGIAAVKSNKAYDINLFSDSNLLVRAVNESWIYKWEANGWTKGKTELLNADLWKELMPLIRFHKIKFIWVKGHAGNPMNERCDLISKSEAQKPNLPSDIVYEQIYFPKRKV